MTYPAPNHLPNMPNGMGYAETPGLEKGSPLSRWAFMFVIFYICILLAQPQNRFLFFYPFRIAMLSMALAMGLHFFSCVQDNRPLIRFGPGTIIGCLLMFFGLISQYFGPLQPNTSWGAAIDTLIKGCILLILIEAMAFNVYRVWVIPAMVMIATLWWVKAGLRLGTAGATWMGDRMMGPHVSLVQNPNAFAYMFCIMLPIYLFFYHTTDNKYLKAFFMFMTLSAVYSILNTGSRTGVVVLVFMAAFLIWKYFWHHKVTLVIGSVAVFMIFGAVGAMNVERFKTIPASARSFFSGEEADITQAVGADEHSAIARRIKNQHSWRLIMEYPVLGAGMHPDHRLFEEHYQHAAGEVHNELLKAGIQMGFVGMGLYIAMLAFMFFGAWKIQRATAGWWPAMSNLGWTFKMMALAIIVGGQFSVLPWTPVHFLLLGSVSALYLNLQAMGVLNPSVMPPAHQSVSSTPGMPPVHARAGVVQG